ncbi:cation:dicarboxylate symporter family transporter [Legionella bononiensis]|uniref:Dicarboxylate/amino acid:cation symporter n=1 Tax=Legionella bononiensis TaxID=2793102 RepID=A0ABS1W748_9GAMM|nr:cation:dicarboxylase symporter family transporter [Legionella bononiensis]MBL7481281.1 dicarboxylate/amino acid:cation symporter [Legionella bononiensis]MBL7525186.1 dicarboxylate/amino acid:cation symporter [Legionella bononiensis]MBL7561369.1 dicarboxylate/amino acid:cation symporter [Legionella bononiensis]
MFRKMPFILLAIILAVLCFAPMMPYGLKQVLYSISLSIKSLIVLALPFIIFALLLKTVLTLSSKATKVIGMILIFVCCSNFISTFLSHFVGIGIYHLGFSMIVPPKTMELLPLWMFEPPKLIANDKAMFAGIILGFILSRLNSYKSLMIVRKIDNVMHVLLSFIVCLIPLFVAGFLIKLQYDGVVSVIIKDYAPIFLLIALAQFVYIGFVLLCLNQFRITGLFKDLKNMLPAVISGFSTMSSAASMPLTIIGVENSTQNKELSSAVIPATVNIHLIGDCFAIPIFAYAVLKSFGMDEPSLLTYLLFTFYFVLAKFSVAAIPGGGIIVMLPILETYLGFNAEMMSLITALYILFDPVITSANVLGNGAFAKMIDAFAAYRIKRNAVADGAISS